MTTLSVNGARLMYDKSKNTDECVIATLIRAINTYLMPYRETFPGVEDVLTQIPLAAMKGNFRKNNSTLPFPRAEILKTAVCNIRAQTLKTIRECILSATDELIWKQDENEYYAPESDLGDGYRANNLHALLIGPSNAKYYHPDFTLGIFLLGPFTLYRDHFHLAPELYLNLTARTGWRFQGGEWIDYGAGSLIWNDSNNVHATRVYDEPFISIFSWTRSINSLCKVFKCADWKKVEQELNDSQWRDKVNNTGVANV